MSKMERTKTAVSGRNVTLSAIFCFCFGGRRDASGAPASDQLTDARSPADIGEWRWFDKQVNGQLRQVSLLHWNMQVPGMRRVTCQ